MRDEDIERYYIWITLLHDTETEMLLSLYVRVDYDPVRECIKRIRMSAFLRYVDACLDSLKSTVTMTPEIENKINDALFIKRVYDTWCNTYKTDYDEFIEKWNEGLNVLRG